MDVADVLIAIMPQLPLLAVTELSGDKAHVSFPVQKAALKELERRETRIAGNTDTADERATTA